LTSRSSLDHLARVLQHKGGCPDGIEPLGDIVALMSYGIDRVASSGADHHGRCRFGGARHQVLSQSGLDDLMYDHGIGPIGIDVFLDLLIGYGKRDIRRPQVYFFLCDYL